MTAPAAPDPVAELNATLAAAPPAAASLPDNHVVADFAAARARAQGGNPVAELNAAFGTGAPAPAPGPAAASANDDQPFGLRLEQALKNFAASAEQGAMHGTGAMGGIPALAQAGIPALLAQAGTETSADLSAIRQHLDTFADNNQGLDTRLGALFQAATSGGDIALLGPLLRPFLEKYATQPLGAVMPAGYDAHQYASDLAMLAQVAAGLGGKPGEGATAPAEAGGAAGGAEEAAAAAAPAEGGAPAAEVAGEPGSPVAAPAEGGAPAAEVAGEPGSPVAASPAPAEAAPAAEAGNPAPGGMSVDRGEPGSPAGAADGTAAAASPPDMTKGAPGAPGDFGFPPHEPPPAEPAGAPQPFRLVGRGGEDLGITPDIGKQARAWAAGESGANPVQASLQGLASDGAMDTAIERAASFIPKGAVKSDDALQMGAYTIQKGPEDVLAGFGGRMPTDEEVAAFGMLLSSAGKEAWTAARQAVASGAPEDWNAAVNAFALQNKIIGDWTTTGTEQARAFRARQLVWDSRGDYTKAVQQVLAEVGPDDMEQAVRGLAAMDDPAKAAPYVSALRRMLGRDGLLFVRYNMLLSNPATVIKKVASDATVGLWNIAVRRVAAEFGSGAVPAGEAAELFQGYVGSMGDAIRAAGKALKAGGSQFASDYQTMDGMTGSRLSALVNGAPEALPAEQPTNAALSFLRSALPTSWIGAADDFAKVANYRAELRALAYRDGMAKLADDSGAVESDALTQHVNDILNNPPQALHEQARAAALANTFQEPLTGLAAKISDVADSLNIPVGKSGYEIPLGRIILPFVKVPANIAAFAYRNSPLPLAMPTDGYLRELAAGGARRDIALARVGLGTAVSTALLAPAVMGWITGGGPSDPQMNRAWQNAGNRPYSIKAPFMDQPMRYNRIEPIGQIIGAVADTADIVRFAHSQDAEQAALSLAFGMGNAMLSKTYMTGLSDFLEALHSPDKDAKRYFESLATSFVVPQGVAGLARATDPFMRAHYSLLQDIESRIPGWGERERPADRSLWGEPVKWDDAFLPPLSGTGAARMLSPVTTGQDHVEPIDKWIWDNRTAFSQSEDGRLGLSKPNKLVQHFDAGPGVSARVRLDPWQLDRYQELAGDALKDPRSGLGAKDSLNALVQGNHPDPGMQQEWDESSPAGRALMVQRVANTFRASAKKQLLAEFPDIGDAVQAGWAQRAAALKAGGGGNSGAPSMPQIGGN